MHGGYNLSVAISEDYELLAVISTKKGMEFIFSCYIVYYCRFFFILPTERDEAQDACT